MRDYYVGYLYKEAKKEREFQHRCHPVPDHYIPVPTTDPDVIAVNANELNLDTLNWVECWIVHSSEEKNCTICTYLD